MSARAALAAAVLALASARLAQASPPAERIAYARESPVEFGDLRLPAGDGPFPLAIVIHGGCWHVRVGSLDSTAPLAEALRADGVATWNVEYRRVGEPGGGWPGTFQDVAAATDFARVLAKDHPIDLGRVVLVGHSAGAQLALWAAARPRLRAGELYRESPLRPRGVVALAGPGDLRGLEHAADSFCGAEVLERLLGGPETSVPSHYADASAAAHLPLGLRQVLVAGSRDPIMPPRAAEPYVRAARESGDAAELVAIRGASHLDLISPSSAAWPVVERKILDLARSR